MRRIIKIIGWAMTTFYAFFCCINQIQAESWNYDMSSCPATATCTLNSCTWPTSFSGGFLQSAGTTSCGTINYSSGINLEQSATIESFVKFKTGNLSAFTLDHQLKTDTAVNVALMRYYNGQVQYYTTSYQNLYTIPNTNTLYYLRIFIDVNGVDYQVLASNKTTVLAEALNITPANSKTVGDIAYPYIYIYDAASDYIYVDNHEFSNTNSIPGECGSDNGLSLYSTPTNTCNVGEFGGFDTLPPNNWTWECLGQNGGDNDQCTAYYLESYNGQCGSDNYIRVISEPINLCSIGTGTGLTLNENYTWQCLPIGNGTSDSCMAYYYDFPVNYGSYTGVLATDYYSNVPDIFSNLTNSTKIKDVSFSEKAIIWFGGIILISLFLGIGLYLLIILFSLSFFLFRKIFF